MSRIKTRSLTFGLATIAMLVAGRPVSVLAQTRTWANANPGNFLTNSNWSGGVAPNGVGQSAVIGANPTASGNFTLNGAQTLGTLKYSNNASGTGRQLAGTGTLTFQASSGNALFHVDADGYLDLNVAGVKLASTTEFRIESTRSVDIFSPISGSGGLTKTGYQTLWLDNANNSYTGLNTITYGALGGSTIANNGTNSSFGRGNFALNDGGTLLYTGDSAATNRTVALGSDGGGISVVDANTVLTWGGAISGNGSLTKWGDGTLQLNASNTYTGDTNLYYGTLRLGASQRISDTSYLRSDSGTTFNLNNFNETIRGIVANGAISLGSGTLTLLNDYSWINGAVSGTGGLTAIGSGVFLNGTSNSYSGLNTANGGTLVGSTIANIGTNSSFGRGNFALSNSGALQYSGASASTNRTIALGTGEGAISVDNANTALTWTGVISGIGSLTKEGSGTLQLNASNTYTGDTNLLAGTLRLGASERIADSSALYIGGWDAMFNLNSFNETIGSLAGYGDVSLGNGTLTTGGNNTSTSYYGVVSGSGNLTKQGTGTMALGAANTYTGNTTVSAGTLQLVAGGAIKSLGTTTTGASGTLTVDGGTLETGSLNRSLGTVNHYDGTIKVNGGAYTQSGTTLQVQSNAANKTATLELAGNGTQSPIDEVQVGYDSNTRGALNITGGRKLNSIYGNLGGYAGSNGTATVTGAGSQWQNSSDLYVGVNGAGNLRVENGGFVSSNNGHVGFNDGSAATATVDGPNAIWRNSAFLFIGEGGRGTLNVGNGGMVTSTYTLLGVNAGSDGTATVGSTASKLQSSSLILGFSGDGSLRVEGGGGVTSSNAYLGFNLGSNGTATVQGAGSKWQNSEYLEIGSSGSGTLNIVGGGTVTVDLSSFLGNQVGSTGTAIVSGPGSQWRNTWDLAVGVEGTGSLTIANSGFATNRYGWIGRYEGSSGTATITGAGSMWQNENELTVGQFGTGTLNVENGGGVTSFDGYLGRYVDSNGTAMVTGNGSLWFSSILHVGDSGTGTLNVENGGLVTGGTGIVGTYSGAIGTVTVTGAGSQLRFSDLYIGNSGGGMLNIENGGLVAAESLISPLTAFLGYNPGSTGVATVNGAGSMWQVGSLYVGYSGTGMLTVDHGGVVEAGSTLAVGALGTVKGDGGIIVGNVVNNGLIAPGSPLGGALTIDGNLTSTGTVTFELAGINYGLFDQLVVSGLADLGGVIEIDLVNGFRPAVGNSFKLLDFGSFADTGYTFDLTHAVLGGGLTWDTSSFSINGTISVVPEPSSLVLALIASLAGVAVWRKRNTASVQ